MSSKLKWPLIIAAVVLLLIIIGAILAVVLLMDDTPPGYISDKKIESIRELASAIPNVEAKKVERLTEILNKLKVGNDEREQREGVLELLFSRTNMTTDELNRAFNKPKFEKCVYGDSDLNELKERLRFRIPPNEREDIIEQLRKMCANKSFEQKEQDTIEWLVYEISSHLNKKEDEDFKTSLTDIVRGGSWF